MARYGTKLKSKPQPKTNWTPLWLVLIGLGLILFAGWAIFNSKAQTKADITVKGAPSLKVEKDSVDHGDVKLGNVIEDDVKVTNVGDQALSFAEAPYLEVKEGCWPPTPTIGSMVLQPGQSTTVSLQYMMHGDMGGKHDFRLHLKTNDPAQPDKEVKLVSNWVP